MHPNLVSFAKGFAIGSGITSAKQNEDSVRAGRNLILTVLQQMTQISYAFSIGEDVLKSRGHKIGSGWMKMASKLGVGLVALAVKNKEKLPEKVHSAALLLQDSIGLICQLATGISSAALCYFGQPVLGGVCLAQIAVGFLDRKGMLPSRVRQLIHQCNGTFGVVLILLLGSLWAKSVTVFAILGECLDQDEKLKKVEPTKSLPKTELNFEQAKEFLKRPGSASYDLMFNELIMRPDHIQKQAEIVIPEADIQELITQFDAIPWEKYRKNIEDALKGDPFFEETQRASIKPGEESLYIKGKLQALIDSVKERHVEAGDIKDYDRLHNYLKFITVALRTDSETIRVRDLLKLAIGGQYCGVGRFHAVEEVCFSKALSDNEMSVENKILLCLQEARTVWFDQEYSNLLSPEDVRRFNNSLFFRNICKFIIKQHSDLHVYNLYLNIYGDEFGIRKGAAADDENASVNGIFRRILRYGSKFSEIFDREYNAKKILDLISDDIGSPRLPRGDVIRWWSEWIDRQKLGQSKKDELRDELTTNNCLFGIQMQEGDIMRPGRFNDRFVAVMLVDMGILGMPKVTQKSSELGNVQRAG